MREGVSFRWGIPELDHGNVLIPEPIYRFHGTVGVKGNYFVLIVQLAAFKYESKRGKSKPSLNTIAGRMGLSKRRVIELVKTLEDDGWLKVKRGDTKYGDPDNNEYNFEPFAKACWALYAGGSAESFTTSTGNGSAEIVTTPSAESFTTVVRNPSPPTKEQEEKNKKSKNKKPSSPKPRVPKEDMNLLTEKYAELQGARPRGDAWKPIQQGMRVMILNEGYSVENVIGCMEQLDRLGWTWTMATLRRWVAAYTAGAMPSTNGDADKRPANAATYSSEDEAEMLKLYESRLQGAI